MPNTQQVSVVPQGTSLQIRVWREGGKIKAVGHLVNGAAEPLTFHAEGSIKPVFLQLLVEHQARNPGGQIAGFPGSILRKAVKIVKSSVVKNIVSAAKTVAKSKITGGIVAAVAVAFPPLGVPAAAAYATANAAIAAIDKANQVKQLAAKALAAGKSLTVKAHAPQVAAVLKDAEKYKSAIKSIAAKAAKGDKEAQAAAKIFAVVKKNRDAAAKLPNKPKGAKGIFISPTFAIQKGEFSKIGGSRMKWRAPTHHVLRPVHVDAHKRHLPFYPPSSIKTVSVIDHTRSRPHAA